MQTNLFQRMIYSSVQQGLDVVCVNSERNTLAGFYLRDVYDPQSPFHFFINQTGDV